MESNVLIQFKKDLIQWLKNISRNSDETIEENRNPTKNRENE